MVGGQQIGGGVGAARAVVQHQRPAVEHVAEDPLARVGLRAIGEAARPSQQVVELVLAAHAEEIEQLRQTGEPVRGGRDVGRVEVLQRAAGARVGLDDPRVRIARGEQRADAAGLDLRAVAAGAPVGPGGIQDLAGAGLPAPSVVRCKLFTLDARLVRGSLGRLAPHDVQEIEHSLGRLFGAAV